MTSCTSLEDYHVRDSIIRVALYRSLPTAVHLLSVGVELAGADLGVGRRVLAVLLDVRVPVWHLPIPRSLTFHHIYVWINICIYIYIYYTYIYIYLNIYLYLNIYVYIGRRVLAVLLHVRVPVWHL